VDTDILGLPLTISPGLLSSTFIQTEQRVPVIKEKALAKWLLIDFRHRRISFSVFMLFEAPSKHFSKTL
jgi:hypothetical protein